MNYTELVTLTNRRIDDIHSYIMRGGTLNYDPQLANIFKEWFNQPIQGMGSSITQKLNTNMNDFSEAKAQTIIKEMLNNKSTLEDMLSGLKDRYNNYSKVEQSIVKSRSQQVKNFELWTSKKGTYLKYVTAGDSNVRSEHAALDGLIRPVTDKIWAEIAPRTDWGCRCILQNVVKPAYVSDSPDVPSDFVDKGIAKNTFYSGQVFTKNHSYFNG